MAYTGTDPDGKKVFDSCMRSYKPECAATSDFAKLVMAAKGGYLCAGTSEARDYEAAFGDPDGVIVSCDAKGKRLASADVTDLIEDTGSMKPYILLGGAGVLLLGGVLWWRSSRKHTVAGLGSCGCHGLKVRRSRKSRKGARRGR